MATFTTLPVVPFLSYPTSTSVTSSIATLGGNITGNGGTNVTRRGVLYALTVMNANPTLGGTGVVEIDDASVALGVFADKISGLAPTTAYSYVAFATNGVGTGYSSVASFTTTPTGPATAIAGPSSALPGQALAFVLNAYEPSSTLQLNTHTFHVSWGDGKTDVLNSFNGASLSHAFRELGNIPHSGITATDTTPATFCPLAHLWLRSLMLRLSARRCRSRERQAMTLSR